MNVGVVKCQKFERSLMLIFIATVDVTSLTMVRTAEEPPFRFGVMLVSVSV